MALHWMNGPFKWIGPFLSLAYLFGCPGVIYIPLSCGISGCVGLKREAVVPLCELANRLFLLLFSLWVCSHYLILFWDRILGRLLIYLVNLGVRISGWAIVLVHDVDCIKLSLIFVHQLKILVSTYFTNYNLEE